MFGPWVKKNKVISITSSEKYDTFKFMDGDNRDQKTPRPIDTWIEFSDYLDNNFKEWTVQLPKDQQNTSWIEGYCDCPIYLKMFICKHIVGLALRLKYEKAPPEAKNMMIGQKRKRGRPSKAKKALIFQ